MAQRDMPEQHETRAIAITGMSLAQALIAVLAGKGILTAHQTNELFETVLASLEAFEQPDPGVEKARVLVDGIAKLVAQHFPRASR